MMWPLAPRSELEATRGTRIAGVYLTREEALHRASDFLARQEFIATQPFFTELGQQGYRVQSPVILTRAWVEEAVLEMTMPPVRHGREVAPRLFNTLTEGLNQQGPLRRSDPW